MDEQPTVYVVDDDPGALRSLTWLLRQADLPVRSFASGREFLNAYQPGEPGCLVLDVRMPEMTGLEVQQALAARGAGLPIIFITAHGDVATCARAFRAGAFDFLEKPIDDAQLLEHIDKAIVRDSLQRQSGSVAGYAAALGQLTPIEREVFDLLVSGKSLKDIANQRNVTIQTAWRHRVNILRKFGVDNQVELVRAATLWAQAGGR